MTRNMPLRALCATVALSLGLTLGLADPASQAAEALS